MKEKTLVILAAGMGSRFGGMKQTYPVGPNDEFIMDYSIYSALKYGFNKVVLIIREEYQSLFEESIGKRIKDKVEVCYAYQKLTNLPEGFEVPEGREKPWGTAHAIYCAKDYINGNFGVITADDFYGDDAFRALSEALDSDTSYSIVGYPLAETLSENGAVKRGVVIEENGKVKTIIESSCTKEDDHVKCIPLDTTKNEFVVKKDNPCSMLMNGFTKDIIDTISNEMVKEFSDNKDNLLDYEMLLPDIMDKEIKSGKEIIVVPTHSTWMGMTYKDDAITLKEFIKEEIDKGIYPNNLW